VCTHLPKSYWLLHRPGNTTRYYRSSTSSGSTVWQGTTQSRLCPSWGLLIAPSLTAGPWVSPTHATLQYDGCWLLASLQAKYALQSELECWRVWLDHCPQGSHALVILLGPDSRGQKCTVNQHWLAVVNRHTHKYQEGGAGLRMAVNLREELQDNEFAQYGLL